MRLARLIRRIAPLLAAALCHAPAYALNETYQGLLRPNQGGTPIPIVVEVRDPGTFLTGNVTTSSPMSGSAPIEFGRNIAGRCNLSVTLNATAVLRLVGFCDPASFRGDYSIQDRPRKTVSRGSFHLDRKAPEPAKGAGTRTAGASTKTVAACMSANTRCLVACPRGADDVEFLCANRCRSRLQTCKAQVGKQPRAIE
jgi:hypothetical protein